MRISTNDISQNIVNQFQQLSSQQSQLQSEVSSGQSVTNPSDDPYAFGNVISLEAQKQQLVQYNSNSNTATAIATQAASSISSLQTIATNASELATQSTGLTSAGEYNANATQVNSLIEQTLQALNSTYNGSYLFGGSATGSPPFTASYDSSGNITGVTYNGTSTSNSIPVADNVSLSPYTSGATNQSLGNFLNNLVTLRDALTSQSFSAVQATQPALASSEDDVVSAAGDVNAVQASLEAYSSQNQAQFNDLETNTSNETSANVAATVVKLNQAQTAYQAALASGQKIMNLSLLNYMSIN